MTVLLRGATAVTLRPPSVQEDVCLRIDGDTISAIGAGLTPEPGEEVVELGGQIVMPGLVVGHHHLYSALARGMPAPFAADEAPTNFHEVLQRIWWRLDKALDNETVYLSAVAGGLDALRCGITSIIDHHASPSAVEGSLDHIARGLGEVGLRGALCYEVSDRDGPAVAEAGLEENRRFGAARAADPLLRGMVGAHASFTIGDETLDRLAELCSSSGAGLHIHLLEDAADRELSQERYGAEPVARLVDRGLLGPRTICAHGVHLTPAEITRLRVAKVWFAHNARSNMNNRVGAAAVGTLGERVLLGTDGIDSDILGEARAAIFRGREHEPPLDAGPVASMLTANQTLISELFGRPFGLLQAGAVADLTILDYRAPTPLTADNVVGHLAYGWGAHLVRSVLVGGRFVYRDRDYVGVDAEALSAATRQGAARLWRELTP